MRDAKIFRGLIDQKFLNSPRSGFVQLNIGDDQEHRWLPRLIAFSQFCEKRRDNNSHLVSVHESFAMKMAQELQKKGINHTMVLWNECNLDKGDI